MQFQATNLPHHHAPEQYPPRHRLASQRSGNPIIQSLLPVSSPYNNPFHMHKAIFEDQVASKKITQDVNTFVPAKSKSAPKHRP